MMTELVKGRKGPRWRRCEGRVRGIEEIGIPLTPIRLKVRHPRIGVLKVALHRAKGTPCRRKGRARDELQLG